MIDSAIRPRLSAMEAAWVIARRDFVAVLFSLVGAFYYLRVVKVMYFDEPQQSAPISQNPRLGGLLALNGAAVLVLGPLSGGLLEWCRSAIVAVLGA